MTPENRTIPDRARRERLDDLLWIGENTFVFWPRARDAFREQGRGAFIVDTTALPVEGKGHPFGYFPQEIIDQPFGEDTRRIVDEYDPQSEFVVVLIKSAERSSTYRVKPLEPAAKPLRRGKSLDN